MNDDRGRQAATMEPLNLGLNRRSAPVKIAVGNHSGFEVNNYDG